MASNDVLLITDEQLLFGSVLCVNTYFYQVLVPSSTGMEAEPLANAFIADMLPAIIGVQSASLTHLTIKVRNLNDPADFIDSIVVSGGTGLGTGEALPPYAAWSFQYLRATTAVRHGWKRIAGIPEGAQSNGVVNAPFTAACAALAEAMEANLEEDPGVGNYIPRIVRRTYVGGVLTAVDPFPIAGVVYRNVSTQNSRKFGVGA